MNNRHIIPLYLFCALLIFVLNVSPALGQDDASSWLILWNVQEKTGSVLLMNDDDRDGVYTLIVPVVQGNYSYRAAIGPQKRPIYGEGGKEGGQPINIDVEGDRKVTFFYNAETHAISAEIGDPFIPPRQVVLVGNLQDEFGHTGGPFGGEWDPAAKTTQMQSEDAKLYTFTGTLPAGTYEYKVAVSGSWQENYGQGGKQDGPNIIVTVEEKQDVTFYYNDLTHKIADSTWYPMLTDDQLPRIRGNLPVVEPEALILRDDDFDLVYATRIPLPPGTYTYRITTGAGTTSPLKLSLDEDREVTVYYESTTEQTFFDDGSVAADTLRHDTYDLAYRDPFEAIMTGQEMTLRLHARKGDIRSAKLLSCQS